MWSLLTHRARKIVNNSTVFVSKSVFVDVSVDGVLHRNIKRRKEGWKERRKTISHSVPQNGRSL